MDSLHKIYVDSSPKGEVRWYNSTTGEIGKHKMGKGKGVHEAEFLAVQRALEDTLKRLREKEAVEIYCDRKVVVDQLNHIAGIKETAVLEMADKVWNMAYRANHDRGIDIKFQWVSRKVNPAGKMLGV